MRKTHRIHKKIAGDKVFCAIVLTLFCLMIIFPFLNVLAISLSSRLSVSQGRVWLWPVGFNLESYKRAFAYDGFLRSYWNTIRYTFMDTVLSLAITMLTAYPLSKSYLRGRKFFNVFFVFTMLFSGGLIASYINMTKMGLNGTIWAVLFPAACSPYTIILMRTFLSRSPRPWRNRHSLTVQTTFMSLQKSRFRFPSQSSARWYCFSRSTAGIPGSMSLSI